MSTGVYQRYPHTEEAKRKMSFARLMNPVKFWLGKKRDSETRKKIGLANSIAQKGRKLSDIHKQRISRSLMGKVFSEEHRKNLRLRPPILNRPRGIYHHNWIVDREKVKRNERNDPEYKQWRIKVLGRDYHICFDCGEIKRGEMQADHIFSWKDYPRLRYQVENGRTLCRDCHKVRTIAQLKGASKLVYNF